MHVVLALCTNCQFHGPRIILTTQPVRNIKDVVPAGTSNDQQDDEANLKIQYGKLVKNSSETMPRCYQCETFDNCVKTNDHQTRTSYISSQIPLNEVVHQKILSACEQAYAEEGTPVKERKVRLQPGNRDAKEDSVPSTSLIFGNDTNGYCLFYKFRVFDVESDLSNRNYSILVVTQDLSHLTDNHDYYLTEFQILKVFLNQIFCPFYHTEPKHYKRDQHIYADFEEIVHKSFVKILRGTVYKTREKLLIGKMAENDKKLLELDTFNATMLYLKHPDAAETKKTAMINLKFVATNMDAMNEPGDFELLIQHLVSGGQVIIESLVTLNELFMLAISQVLPYGCIKVKPCARSYLPEYRDMFNIVCVYCNTETPQDAGIMKIKVLSTGEWPLSYFHKAIFKVTARPNHYFGSTPSLVKRYINLLEDSDISLRVLRLAMNTSKEEWLQKAKLFYMMKKKTNGSDDEIFAKIFGCAYQDRRIVKFFVNGLSDSFKSTLEDETDVANVSSSLANVQLT